jgi:glycine/D-amino acid oxidase-like deaminating enzyme
MSGWDAVVVGGGLAGVSVAHHLVASGARTALVDRHDPGRATDAGAGILSPETAQHAHPGWWPLVRACGDHYRDLMAHLDGDTGYAVCGLLSVALGDWDRTPFEALRNVARTRAAARGISTVDELDPERAQVMFPALATVTAALHNPVAARVDGRSVTGALLAAAVDRGLDLVEASARLVLRDGRVTAVEAGGRTLPCGAVVIAGGAWTPEVASQLGASIPVHPERGQIVHLHTELDTDGWPILQPVMGCYFVPWPGGRVVVGATREAAGFAVRPTAAGVRLVLNEVARVAPGLVDAELVEVRVGLRPASDDDLPIVGPLPDVPNVHLATGYGANGLLLSPWCGRQVAAAITGAGISPVLEPFGPGRFGARV